ncbi:MAG: class I SAM-dependent methyltransferase [Acidobacteria bacterium]|nr:class I SAM-dependent methyltransferase [Acidobacteriota bacterium]
MSVETAMASDLEVMAQANNYRDWMYRRIEPFVGRRVLEVGAGIGNFTQLLLDRELVVPTDISRLCLARLEERLGDRLRARPKLLDLGDPSDEDWAAYDFDTIICMNVLEHVEDDAAALSFMHSALVEGGRAIILVPAFMFLHGTIDRSIGHYRRYTRKELLPRMRTAGFRVERSFYMNVVGIAGWFWNNRVRRIAEEDRAQIRLFDTYIAPWAERVERALPPPFGLSLIAVGRRES